MSEKEKSPKKLLSIVKDLLIPKPKIGPCSYELDDAKSLKELEEVYKRYSNEP